MRPRWRPAPWMAGAALALFAAAAILLTIDAVRTARPGLVAVAAGCLALGGLAWGSRHRMKGSVA